MSWFGTSPWPSLDDERKLAIGLDDGDDLELPHDGEPAAVRRARALPDAAGRVGRERARMDPVPARRRSTTRSASARRTSVEHLSMKPSEYFQRQMHVVLLVRAQDSFTDAIGALGPDNIMFETDFPHPTCLYPDSLERAPPKASSTSSRRSASNSCRRTRRSSTTSPFSNEPASAAVALRQMFDASCCQSGVLHDG